MTDEATIEEQEIEAPPVQQYSWEQQEQEQTPQYATAADIEAAIQRVTQRPAVNPQNDDEAELAKIVEMGYTDPLAAERLRQERVSRITQASVQGNANAAMLETMAPMLRSQIVASITEGQPKEAVAYVEKYLSNYSGQALSNLAKDPGTMEVLRLAAEGRGARAKGASVQAPRTEGTSGTGEVSLDAETEKQVELAFRQMGHTGLTREDIRKEFAKEVS